MRGLLIVLLVLLGTLTVTAPPLRADGLRLCQQAPDKYAYRLELTELILQRTAARYGEWSIAPSTQADPTQERCLVMLRDGLVDMAFVPPTAQRLHDFAVIPIDLHAGMLGYRLLLIHKDAAARFAGVNNLEQLRQLTGGFGNQWADFSVFASNQLPVVGMANPNTLLAMLNKHRFDYFHRGLHEAWGDLQAHAEEFPDLMVEPHLALVYDLPVYFTFNRSNLALRKRFADGLAQLQADGSLRRLFLRHYGKVAEQAQLPKRTLIPLNYPNPAGVPAIDTGLWLRPSPP
ncbi:MAG: transporter substrate-binding domain-containing protein [Pseudomonadaceae bacterium]|nr:transporter substrate-binding domain-containing protein [Pseudomonadaceae bacterium]